MCSQVMMTTHKKASMVATIKALVSVLNKLRNSFLVCDQGVDKAAASNTSDTTTTIQTNIVGSWAAKRLRVGKPRPMKADNCQPNIPCVTSSSVKEPRGNFFKLGIQ